MTERSVRHSTFVIERTYHVPPARVFAAYADPVKKARWFAEHPEWGPDLHTMDFRVGGRETSRGGPPGGPVHFFDGRFQEIVPDERIIFAYNLSVDETLISVSLATVEFKPDGTGTRMIFTEQGAFLEGYDDPAAREHGTGALLDALGTLLEDEATLS